MIETLTSSPDKLLNHDFQGVIQEIINGVETGIFNPEEAFRYAWRAAFAKEIQSEERIAGLDTLLNSFPKEVQTALNRPLDQEGENALMIIAAQEEAKAIAEGRLPQSRRKHFRRQTSLMRKKLN